jgi:hypothetical protein
MILLCLMERVGFCPPQFVDKPYIINEKLTQTILRNELGG